MRDFTTDYLSRLHQDLERDKARQMPHPQDIFELAAHDAMIRAHVEEWRRGSLTWEQMLTAIVKHLAGEVKQFREAEFQRLRISVSGPPIRHPHDVWFMDHNDGTGAIAKGWYARLTNISGPHVLRISSKGPFATERECREWCDTENAKAKPESGVTMEQP